MIKTAKILTLLITITLLISSFTSKNHRTNIGTYGVSASDASQIRLTINSDNTFYYQDFSIPNKKIIAEGSWSLKGRKVILKSNNSDIKFHTHWSFLDNG